MSERISKNLRVLLILLEFPVWKRARPLSYCLQFAYEEGFAAHGIDCDIVATPFLQQARVQISGRRYDQVWLEAFHTEYTDDDFEWIAGLAPVRVGMIGESLEYSEQELTTVVPHFRNIRSVIEGRMKYLTHILACDEKDADRINASGMAAGAWWPQAVPARCIRDSDTAPILPYAAFGGVPYGKRAQFVENPNLMEFMRRLPPAENHTVLPDLFNTLNDATSRLLGADYANPVSLLNDYVNILRPIRRKSFDLWIDALASGGAIVNLPHLVKGYAGRVSEGMAAGRPVVSWEVPDRPRNRALFEHKKEILLFDGAQPEQLAGLLRRVITGRATADRIAAAAREKIRAYHTIEHRTAQVLKWIDSGEEPKYD